VERDGADLRWLRRTAPNIDQATAIAAIEELTGGLLEVTA
jgi:hypothetical protein